MWGKGLPAESRHHIPVNGCVHGHVHVYMHVRGTLLYRPDGHFK